MFRRGVVWAVAAMILSGCVSDQVGTDYATVVQKVGPPKAGLSRIVVLQEKRNGLSMAICACDMKLDGESIGKVMVGRYAYADVPAGRRINSSPQKRCFQARRRVTLPRYPAVPIIF